MSTTLLRALGCFLAPGVLAFLSPAMGQSLVSTIDGPVGGVHFGRTVCGIGDVDLDGVPDLLIVMDGDPTLGVTTTLAEVRSGASGATLHAFAPSNAWCAPAGDLNFDGVPDFLISQGWIVTAYSGASFTSLYNFPSGTEVRIVGEVDVDQDGWPDVIISKPGMSNGYVDVFSGNGGALIYTFQAPAPNAYYFGAAIGAADIDGDGFPDILVGSPVFPNPPFPDPQELGKVYIYSGKTGALLRTHQGAAIGDGFAWAVAAAGDYDHDGKGEYAISRRAPGSGSVAIYRGSTGSKIKDIPGEVPYDGFGFCLDSSGDVDNDGVRDLIIGRGEVLPMTVSHYVKVFSGNDGALLARLDAPPSSTNGFGFAVAWIGDVNGDGDGEIGVGDVFAPQYGSGPGRVSIHSLLPNGIEAFGSGSPGCAGAHAVDASPPKVGNATFHFSCTNAPAGALGILMIADVANLGGYDPMALGIVLHLDLFGSSNIGGIDAHSNAQGYALAAAPIPNNPALAGIVLYSQFAWLWTGACSPTPFGLSTSPGVKTTFQP